MVAPSTRLAMTTALALAMVISSGNAFGNIMFCGDGNFGNASGYGNSTDFAMMAPAARLFMSTDGSGSTFD